MERLARLAPLRILRNAAHRAYLRALRLVEVADAFRALARVDLIDLLAHRDGVVRALRLADAAVDTLVGVDQRHQSEFRLPIRRSLTTAGTNRLTSPAGIASSRT